MVQILSAIYLSSSTTNEAIKEMARLFPPTEVVKYRTTLEKLGAKAKSIALGPDALTLQGLFLEREGQKQKAIELFQQAVLLSHLTYNPKTRHPMQLDLIAPWNALGFLFKAEKDSASQTEAKRYFRTGALEADDPLSYYEMATFEQRSSLNWLHYTSKAAASGHIQATADLADFYEEVSSKTSPSLANTSVRKALKWILCWKRGSVADLAREWLQAGANLGHKPSMLKLAKALRVQ